MITVSLTIGTLAAYLLVGFVLYLRTFREVEPDKVERGLLAFAPALYAIKHLADRFSRGTSRDEPDGRPQG